jgi:hypothetical protein
VTRGHLERCLFLIMNSLPTCLIGVVVGSLATASLARADSPVSDEPAGEYAVQRGVQGPAGMLSARILLDVNLSSSLVGKPISLAPDLYYSVTDRLQLGLLHQGPMGWQARPGVGLCLTGTENGCPKIYNNVGFDLMYGLTSGGSVDLSAHGSLFMNSFSPASTSLAVGVAGKLYFSKRFALLFDPKIAIAVNDRSTNHDDLFVPLELEWQVGALTTFKLLSGIEGDVSAFSNTYQIPVGVGLVRNLSHHFDLGARFSFDNLLGNQPPGVGAADARSLAVLLNIRS